MNFLFFESIVKRLAALYQRISPISLVLELNLGSVKLLQEEAIVDLIAAVAICFGWGALLYETSVT